MKSGHLQSDFVLYSSTGCFENGVQVFFFLHLFYALLIYVTIFVFKESSRKNGIFSNGACS